MISPMFQLENVLQNPSFTPDLREWKRQITYGVGGVSEKSESDIAVPSLLPPASPHKRNCWVSKFTSTRRKVHQGYTVEPETPVGLQNEMEEIPIYFDQRNNNRNDPQKTS